MAGCDMLQAWELTPGELAEYTEIFRQRMEIQSYWGYNLAQCIAIMALGSTKPEPWQVFPGWIQQRKEMTDEEIYASCLAWCGGDPNGSRTTK